MRENYELLEDGSTKYLKDEDIELKIKSLPYSNDFLFIEDLYDKDRDIALPRSAQAIDKLITLLSQAKEKLL